MRAAGADRATALEADLAFHVALARATHNGALTAAVMGVREVLRGLIGERVVDLPEAIRQHEEILGCVEAGDAEGARAAIGRHMTWISGTLDGVTS
jgi:DNA-binding FadR family transcriptional regulator